MASVRIRSQRADRFRVQRGVGRLVGPALVVLLALQREVGVSRRVEQQRHERVAAAVFVHVGRAVPDPLARDEHRHGAVELEFHHLARRRVPVPSQVADQAARLARPARAVTIADASGALDAVIAAHVVHQRHEAVVENGIVLAEDLLGGWIRRALGLHGPHRGQAVQQSPLQ
jgi:hypothetical protein